MTVGARASAIISVLQNDTALPMAGVMTCCAVAAFTIFAWGRKSLIQQVAKKAMNEADVEVANSF